MQALRDAPVRQYAETVARFHQLGSHYPHPITGSQATWESKWRDRDDLWNALQSGPYVSRTLVLRAMELIEHTRPSQLFATMLHGDFRLWHVFFVDDHVSGIVDVDQSTSGERWVDVCYGLLNGADPERGSFLDGAALQVALQTYHRLLPFTSSERAVLPAIFAYATLETLRDLLPGVMAGTAGRQDLEATQNLFVKILTTTEEALLGG